MRKPRDRIEIWSDDRGEWRWQRFRNGCILGGGAEGYRRRRDMMWNMMLMSMSAKDAKDKKDSLKRIPMEITDLVSMNDVPIIVVEEPSSNKRRG